MSAWELARASSPTAQALAPLSKKRGPSENAKTQSANGTELTAGVGFGVAAGVVGFGVGMGVVNNGVGARVGAIVCAGRIE